MIYMCFIYTYVLFIYFTFAVDFRQVFIPEVMNVAISPCSCYL